MSSRLPPPRRAARLSAGLAASSLVLAATVVPGAAQPPPSPRPASPRPTSQRPASQRPASQRQSDDPTLASLARALDRRMTVFAAGERVLYVRHCRAARGGCQQRVATFARLIDDASRTHALDPFLLAAVAVRESGMDPEATGAAGERGIVQLHPHGSGSGIRFVRSAAYRRRCQRRPDACQGEVLEAGAQLLANSIRRCGGVREGLGAYNRGACGATDYAGRVMRERQRLLRLAKSDARSIHDLD